MKKGLVTYVLIFISILSYSQNLDSLKQNLISFDKVISNKEREKKIRQSIDNHIINNKKISSDTLNMSYGLFVDVKGEIFVTYNDINDSTASNSFEELFKTTFYINSFKDSLTLKKTNYNFKGINRYLKKENHYLPFIPKNNEILKSSTTKNIEQVPRYRGCKKDSNENMKKCMSDKITKLIGKKFNLNKANSLNLKPGVHRIFVRFKINKKGNVSNISVRAPHPVLANEAKRVINLIPKMKEPGKQNGKVVNVRYALPIIFRVNP